MNTILTKEFLEEYYLDKKLKVRDIVKKTGYSYAHIQTKIKQFGIPRHRQYIDLEGKIFGKLSVQKFIGVDNKQQALWNCLCSCGNHKIIKSSLLKNGDIKSCGCLYIKRCGDISGSVFFNIKNHARLRNLSFNITIEEIWNLYLKQNKTCAISGVGITFDIRIRKNTTASLDRIDSTKGYTIDNVQWVHKDINQMKSNRTDGEFLSWIRIISDYQKSKKSK